MVAGDAARFVRAATAPCARRIRAAIPPLAGECARDPRHRWRFRPDGADPRRLFPGAQSRARGFPARSEEHTSELQSHVNLVCRLLLEKKKNKRITNKSIYN